MHVNQERKDGVTPLMVASIFGQVEVCEFLLLNNAVIILKDRHGHNALFISFVRKNATIANS